MIKSIFIYFFVHHFLAADGSHLLARASHRHFVEKRRIVIASAGLVDAARHWPRAQPIFRGWL
jgi:hypothetical protein